MLKLSEAILLNSIDFRKEIKNKLSFMTDYEILAPNKKKWCKNSNLTSLPASARQR